MGLVKSKQRVADHGEVFTPPELVEAMLGLVRAEVERVDARFLEPACGSGNFLVPILLRKFATVEARYGRSDFERRHHALLALMSLYGIELLADNVAECRENLLEVVAAYLGVGEDDEWTRAARNVLATNVVHGDALSMRTEGEHPEPITFAEWSYLGQGRFHRRDFRFDTLTQMSSFGEDDTLFADLGKHEIFTPTTDHGTLTVADCGASQAALDRGQDLETHAYAFIHTGDIKTRIAEMFGDDMQFDVIIGNPPYQLDDGGFGTSAAPIYQLFVEQAKALDPRLLAMVIPSRWFTGGKNLDDFRASMLADDRVRSIDDFLSAADVFPGVGLKGGVCYFLWDRDSPGLCRVTTHFKGWADSTATRPLLEVGADVFVRFNEGLSILQKVMAIESDQVGSVSLPTARRFDGLVSSLRPFGLRTFFKGKEKKGGKDLTVYQNGGKGYIARSEISTGKDLIDCWKIYVGRAAPGTGNRDTYPHKIISTPFVGEPGSICSETYLCIGPFQSKAEAENALSYLSSRLTRLLVLLHKPSADTTRKVYAFVPTQDWTRSWTDADLYAKYGITDDEVAFIEKVVRPMDLDSGTSGDADE